METPLDFYYNLLFKEEPCIFFIYVTTNLNNRNLYYRGGELHMELSFIMTTPICSIISPFSTTKRHYIFTFEYSLLNFHTWSLFYLYQHLLHNVIKKLNYSIAHNGTLLLTHHNWDLLKKKKIPPGWFFRGTPSEMICHNLNYICAKFGVFTRLVTVFVIFRPNRPDHEWKTKG